MLTWGVQIQGIALYFPGHLLVNLDFNTVLLDITELTHRFDTPVSGRVQASSIFLSVLITSRDADKNNAGDNTDNTGCFPVHAKSP